jgi:hypothetical protein
LLPPVLSVFRHSFGLQLKDDKIYYFAARGAEDLLPWLQSVRKELRRMAETSPSAVKEIVPTAPATPATAPDTTKPKERSKREKREKKSTPEKSKEGKPKDRNGTFSGLFAKLSSMAAGSGDDKVLHRVCVCVSCVACVCLTVVYRCTSYWMRSSSSR